MADYLDESYRHDGEDEDDGGTFDADKINNDHVILLVDARESMLETMTTDGEVRLISHEITATQNIMHVNGY